jgi:hypothetical protein
LVVVGVAVVVVETRLPVMVQAVAAAAALVLWMLLLRHPNCTQQRTTPLRHQFLAAAARPLTVLVALVERKGITQHSPSGTARQH